MQSLVHGPIGSSRGWIRRLIDLLKATFTSLTVHVKLRQIGHLKWPNYLK